MDLNVNIRLLCVCKMWKLMIVCQNVSDSNFTRHEYVVWCLVLESLDVRAFCIDVFLC